MKTKLEIVSGEPSRPFWGSINLIDPLAMATGDEIKDVLYFIGCKMQELETEIEKCINQPKNIGE